MLSEILQTWQGILGTPAASVRIFCVCLVLWARRRRAWMGPESHETVLAISNMARAALGHFVSASSRPRGRRGSSMAVDGRVREQASDDRSTGITERLRRGQRIAVGSVTVGNEHYGL